MWPHNDRVKGTRKSAGLLLIRHIQDVSKTKFAGISLIFMSFSPFKKSSVNFVSYNVSHIVPPANNDLNKLYMKVSALGF